MIIRVEQLYGGSKLAEALLVRKQVFHVEGGIPLDHVIDDQDASAEHFAAFDNAMITGTARYRRLDEDDEAKVERVAVLEDFRGWRIGSAIMSYLEKPAVKQGITRLTLDSKLGTVGFYEKLGFITQGETFCEVGLPHIKMSKNLID